MGERLAASPKLRKTVDMRRSMSDPGLRKSSAQHFLELQYGTPNPYDSLQKGRPVTPDKLLRYGLSGYVTKRPNGAFNHAGINEDGEGRAGYLRFRGKLSPVQKYQQPITSNQTVGWGAETFDYKRGNYNRKPL